MKYYLIAGEASGDLHASGLMQELHRLDPEAQFRCWGGDLMEQAGGTVVRHFRDLAFMGFLEVARNFRTILRNFRYCESDLLQYQPDVLILVDYPGFNLRVAKFAAAHGIRVFYYISPQLWAWRSSRVHKVRKYVEHMFVILPFEKEFYSRFGYRAEFVGHPLLDILSPGQTSLTGEEFRKQNGLGREPLVALLPGSRKQEISVMLHEMLRVIPEFPGYRFVVAAAPSIAETFYSSILRGHEVAIVYHQTQELLGHAAAALVTSGTATLETALCGAPEVVCYKGNPLSYWIARRVVHVPYISLVNLIAGKEVVKELIQRDLNTKNLIRELTRILDPSVRDRIRSDYNHLRERLGGSGASARTAALMVQYLRENGVIHS